MLKVTVTFLGLIRNAIGRREIEVKLNRQKTIGDLLEKICETYGERFQTFVLDPKTHKTHRHITILLNDVNILSQENLNTKLKGNDRVIIMPVVAGG